MLEMVEERLTATPTVAVIGVIGPAVRSGAGAPLVAFTDVEQAIALPALSVT